MKYYCLKAFTLLSCILLGVTAHAHDFEAQNSDDIVIYYNIISTTDKTCEVTYRGSSYSSYSDEYTGSITIPETVPYNGITYSITRIGASAFYGCIGLTSITIPNSVTDIDYDAFRGCIGLTNITIPNRITYIGLSAFYGTGWYENQLDGILYLNNCCLGYKKNKPTGNLTLKEGTGLIATWAFRDCADLTSVSIPNSVTSIGAGAFRGCSSLTSVTIPNSVTRIGDGAFTYCAGLELIIVESGNMKYDSRDNCNALIESASNTIIRGSNNTIIPNSITAIGECAFEGCSKLSYIKLLNSIHTIEEGAFRDCISLTSVEIPSSINCIKQTTFYGCTNLNSINIPSSVTSIGQKAFYNTKWYNSQDNGVLYLCNCCLGYKGNAPIGDLTIKDGTRIIADMSFLNCNELKTITIPSSITNFGYDSFGGTKGLAVNIESLESWCNIDFDYNSNPLYSGKLHIKGVEVNELTIPDNITKIKNYTFRGCISINTVKIPDTTKFIGASAFTYCYNLEKIFIGNSIENIGSTAFQGCSKIHEIVCFPKNPPVSDAWFPETVRQTATLYVPEESICLYQVADEWKYFSNIKGFSSSAIKEILLDEENEVNVIEIARYDISGRLLSAPVKGINFVKMSDGSMKKVIVK